MLNNLTLKALSFLVVPLMVTACDDTGSTGPADGSATVSLLLTDAPGDLGAAVVTITDVYLQGEGEDGGRVYLLEDASVTTDLLTLSNDVLELVDGYEVPAGTYSQLRFVISGAYLEVENAGGGTTVYATSSDYEGLPLGVEADGDLMCPSCAQSGFKVLLGPVSGDYDEEADGEVVLEGDQTLLIDFDVSRSFGHQAGNSGKWVMRPTLKATRLAYAAELDVTLGLADPAPTLPLIDGSPLDLASFEVTLTPAAGGDPKIATFADPDGDGVLEASFGFLFPGDYEVGLRGVEGLTFVTDVALPVSVMLEEGSEETVDLRLTELSL
jgi:hypothetical protein